MPIIKSDARFSVFFNEIRALFVERRALYHCLFAKLEPSDLDAKIAALRRYLAHAFSPPAAKRLPNREFSRHASASLYLQNRDLHFGPEVRVYRADLFFGAMDGGIDAVKKENVGFYGPFATVSVGLGG